MSSFYTNTMLVQDQSIKEIPMIDRTIDLHIHFVHEEKYVAKK